jgi:hypothetical protein
MQVMFLFQELLKPSPFLLQDQANSDSPEDFGFGGTLGACHAQDLPQRAKKIYSILEN